jgi:hypothetical protein
MLILACGLCAALGYLAIASIWPQKNSTLSALLIRLSLTPAFGLGIFSAIFWLMPLRGDAHVVAVDASLLGVLGLAYAVRRSHATKENTHPLSSRAKMNCPDSPGNSSQSRDLAFASHSLNQSFSSDGPDINAPEWIARVLMACFGMALIAALYQATVRVIAHPHGEGWDAFAIWNLHARFLFLGGAHWRDGFNSMIPWSHPDYPLLLPAAIAHLWSYLGHDDPLAPAMVGLIFTFSALALLVSSLAWLRGRNVAMLGGLALSSTPFFVEQGTSQYADVPLSFFILATFVLLHMARSQNHNNQNLAAMMLSGTAASFAAWTKNEGLLFLSALLVAQVWAAISSSRQQDSSSELAGKWRPFAYFVSGAAPLLCLIAWFKHTIAVRGDLLSSPSIMIQKILTPTRYWIILQWFAKELVRFGNWWIIPGTMAMLAFSLLSLRRRKPDSSPLLHLSILTLILTLAGYFAIYLITPRDLYWHLRFSLNRLFLQLWPSAIFLFFLFVGRQAFAEISNGAIAPKRETVKKFTRSP